MKITHNKVGTNLNTADSAKTDKADKAKAQGGKTAVDTLGALDSRSSKVDLSPRAQEMKKIKEIATAAPDVDEAKVAKYQKMIDEGTYNVSAKDIADKMVDEELNWI